VKQLWSDNGGEYDSKQSHAWFDKTGIQWELTVPYTPEQKGVSQSLNRMLMDRVQSVLFDKVLE
jgi:transposase InsO family protein